MISKIKKFLSEKTPILASILQPIYYAYKEFLSKVRIIEPLIKSGKDISIEVGAGEKSGENGWVTIDVTKECDIFWDLRKGIPFPSNSVSKIYSSHFMEHLSFAEGQEFLKESLRVLKPSGIFSICVPDAKLWIDAYAKNDMLDKDKFLTYEPACNYTTKIDYVNYIAYMDGSHKYMFDEENLIFLLRSAGFNHAKSREFDPSIDLERRRIGSIYAEAKK